MQFNDFLEIAKTRDRAFDTVERLEEGVGYILSAESLLVPRQGHGNGRATMMTHQGEYLMALLGYYQSLGSRGPVNFQKLPEAVKSRPCSNINKSDPEYRLTMLKVDGS